MARLRQFRIFVCYLIGALRAARLLRHMRREAPARAARTPCMRAQPARQPARCGHRGKQERAAGANQPELELTAAHTRRQVLIQYVGDLKREAEAGRRRAHLVDQWCSESLAQKTSFVAALQRESDELATARRELALQERCARRKRRLGAAGRGRAGRSQEFDLGARALGGFERISA